MIGFILFMFASFLSLINNSGGKTFSILNFYTSYVSTGRIPPLNAERPLADYWLLLAMVLYPIALCLSYISLFRARMMLFAGNVGLLTWIAYVVAVSVASSPWSVTALVGPAVYVGIIGAAMLVTAYYLRRKSVREYR